MLTIAVLGIGAVIVRWLMLSAAVQVNLPHELFPEGLSAELEQRIEAARSRVVQQPDARNWGALAKLLMAHDLFFQADYCFQRAIEQQPDEEQWWYLRGILNEEHNLAVSVECYRHALKLAPYDWFMEYRLGRLLMRTGELDKARQILQQAKSGSNSHPAVVWELARLAEMDGDAGKAVELLSEAVADPRTGQDLCGELARLYERQGNHIDASIVLKSSIDRPVSTEPIADPWLKSVAVLSPQLADDSQNAASLAVQGKWKEAMQLYQKLSVQESRNSRPQIYHAMMLAELRRTDEAVQEIDKVCQQFPTDPLARSCQASILQAAGQPRLAIQALREAIELKPDFVEARKVLAALLSESGDSEAATQELEILQQFQSQRTQ